MTIKVRNLTQYGQGWSFDVHFDQGSPDDLYVVHYRTNTAGEGLWANTDEKKIPYYASYHPIYKEFTQIEGTSQFDLRTPKRSTAYSRIRRYFNAGAA